MANILISDNPKFSQPPADNIERETYINHMQSMFHKTTAPPILYKGQAIPERFL